jgi:tetratricopeptide (TPR) repeat protein
MKMQAYLSILSRLTVMTLLLIGSSRVAADDPPPRLPPPPPTGKTVEELTELIRIRPKSTELYRERGRTWGFAGELDKAIDDYTESIRLDPDAFAYYYRGREWDKKREFEEAIAD